MDKIGSYLIRIMRPVDWLVAGYQLAMVLISIIFRNNLETWLIIATRHLLALVVVIGVRVLVDRYPKRWLVVLSEWYLGLTLPLAYTWAGDFIHAIFPWISDHILHSIDLKLLGTDPTAYLQRLSRPWLTDIMQLAYCSYFFIIFFGYLILYIKGERRHYQNYEFMIIASLYGTYLWFMLLPAYSPRFVTCPELMLQGGWITEQINQFLSRAAYAGGAFPSGHAAVSISICVFIWRYARAWAPLFILLTLLLLVSTVYGGYHYVIDLLAGAIHGGLASLMVVLWNRQWRRRGWLK